MGGEQDLPRAGGVEVAVARVVEGLQLGVSTGEVIGLDEALGWNRMAFQVAAAEEELAQEHQVAREICDQLPSPLIGGEAAENVQGRDRCGGRARSDRVGAVAPKKQMT